MAQSAQIIQMKDQLAQSELVQSRESLSNSKSGLSQSMLQLQQTNRKQEAQLIENNLLIEDLQRQLKDAEHDNLLKDE